MVNRVACPARTLIDVGSVGTNEPSSCWSNTQCAAVRIHCVAMMEPPQNCPSNSGRVLSELTRATCQGASAIVACTPPTISGVTPAREVADTGDADWVGAGVGVGLEVTEGADEAVADAVGVAEGAAKAGAETPNCTTVAATSARPRMALLNDRPRDVFIELSPQESRDACSAESIARCWSCHLPKRAPH